MNLESKESKAKSLVYLLVFSCLVHGWKAQGLVVKIGLFLSSEPPIFGQAKLAEPPKTRIVGKGGSKGHRVFAQLQQNL